MTTGEMLVLTNRLKEIQSSEAPKIIKNARLQVLLKDIENAYESNEFAIRLYYTVLSEVN